MRMRHIICRLCPVRLCCIFPHYLTNGTILRKQVIKHKVCVLIFSINLSEIFLILRRIQRDIITNVHRSSCKVPVIFVRLQGNLNFLDIFSKNSQISNLTKIRPVGTELFHADGRTDMTKPIVAFCNMQTRLNTETLEKWDYNIITAISQKGVAKIRTEWWPFLNTTNDLDIHPLHYSYK